MRTYWKANDIIREKTTGQPFLVLHVYTNIATIMADLGQTNPIAIVLLERNYDKFAKDTDMKQTVEEETEEWHYDPVPEFV